MKVRDLMKTPIVVLEPSNKIIEACKVMDSLDIGFMPIVQNGVPIGVITDRDIVLGISKGIDTNQDVYKLIHKDPVTIKADAEIGLALTMMSERQIRRLIVVNEEHQVCGVISIGDLSRSEETNTRTGFVLSSISLPHINKTSTPHNLELKVSDFPL